MLIKIAQINPDTQQLPECLLPWEGVQIGYEYARPQGQPAKARPPAQSSWPRSDWNAQRGPLVFISDKRWQARQQDPQAASQAPSTPES